MNNTMVLTGYPGHYETTTARNYYARLTNKRAYSKLSAVNKVDALEILRANFPDCEIVDKAVS